MLRQDGRAAIPDECKNNYKAFFLFLWRCGIQTSHQPKTGTVMFKTRQKRAPKTQSAAATPRCHRDGSTCLRYGDATLYTPPTSHAGASSELTFTLKSRTLCGLTALLFLLCTHESSSAGTASAYTGSPQAWESSRSSSARHWPRPSANNRSHDSGLCYLLLSANRACFPPTFHHWKAKASQVRSIRTSSCASSTTAAALAILKDLVPNACCGDLLPPARMHTFSRYKSDQ